MKSLISGMNVHSPDELDVDVLVIGAGHAGCEAALAAARAGCRTLVLTPNLDRVGFMPCNPSVGGPGKSHLVAEVDALGGAIAIAADRAALQVRRLNTSKGPAVQAVRIQTDKSLYALAMKEILEHQPRLVLRQDEVTGLRLGRDGADRMVVTGVSTRHSGDLRAGVVVLTAGTFLRGALVTGESRHTGGRAGDKADTELAATLHDIGFATRRLKTGTPPRIDARSVDFAELETQHGDEPAPWLSRDGRGGRLEPLGLPPIEPFRSLSIPSGGRPQIPCFRTSTNPRTHELIRANLHRAPMFNGGIEGRGPRYCPSVEDKVARFTEKASHPVFLEPEGWRNAELYVQGMSTSLPPEVQLAALRTIPGLAQVHVTRFGYAVEYDAVDPAEIDITLESRRVRGLFLAGQVNGTSGYEEAAGQGIIAGINAAARVLDRPPLVLSRATAYIGVMIDDLVTKPFDEPYRMLTSRAEFRLLLRPTTADARLAPVAAEYGLIDRSRQQEIERQEIEIRSAVNALARIRVTPGSPQANALSSHGLGAVSATTSARDLLRRPEATIDSLRAALSSTGDWALAATTPDLLHRVEEAIKYDDFLLRESREAERRSRMDDRRLPLDLDYTVVRGLRREATEKLSHHRPRTVGEASRLAGVTPADVAVLLIHAAHTEALTS